MLAVLKALKAKQLSRKQIFEVIGKKNDFRAFKRHVEPLLRSDLIEMTLPDKPSSKLQKYKITGKGLKALRVSVRRFKTTD